MSVNVLTQITIQYYNVIQQFRPIVHVNGISVLVQVVPLRCYKQREADSSWDDQSPPSTRTLDESLTDT